MRALFLLLILIAGGAAAQDAANPADARISARIETAHPEPYEREMAILILRGFYGVPITREFMQEPDFAGLSWVQLGEDSWFDGEFEGRQLKGFERRYAIFPQYAGHIHIAPFSHELKLMGRDGRRFEEGVATNAVDLDIRAAPQGRDWWMPALSVEISESWTAPPDEMVFGQPIDWSVRLAVKGVTADMLPPQPDLIAPGANLFPHPELRTTELTPDGPIARVEWRWTVTLLRPEPATTPAVEVPWFDITAREMRMARLPEHRMAIAAPPEPPGAGLRLWATPIGLGLGGVIVAVALALALRRRPVLWAKLWRRLRPDPARRAVRRARTPEALRRALWSAARGGARVDAGALDAALFGRAGERLDLRAAKRQALRRLKAQGPEPQD